MELKMEQVIEHTTLHRTAKYFMDNGRAETHGAAMDLLAKFGLTIFVGPEVARSANHQVALLTLINVARRTLLGGVEVVGLLDDAMSITALAPDQVLRDAVHEFGGTLVSEARQGWPSAVIGSAAAAAGLAVPCWRLTWSGWRGGVVPVRDGRRLAEGESNVLGAVLAAATCAAEAFAYHAEDHPMAGRRATGISLWRPDIDWLAPVTEPELAFLPSRLWIIGLGNLGQAFAWLLACLPYEDRNQIDLVLQDFDVIAASNDSTSLLSFLKDIDRKKTRVVSDWLEKRGFKTTLEERKFGTSTRRTDDEPGVALCGVDNANARAVLDRAGFGLIVEAGLGAGPQAFRSVSMHTLPASRTAAEIWSRHTAMASPDFEQMPAYQALKRQGMDACGLTQLASRTVGVPFVGLIAACLVISELLRRLHGGVAIEVASASVSSLADIEVVVAQTDIYDFGHVPVAKRTS
jgi:hypothetical protein